MLKARILITGAAGFLGANLVRRLLESGAETHGIVRPQTDRWRLAELGGAIGLHCADLRDSAAVEAAIAAVRPEIVFHIALPAGHPATEEQRREILEASLFGTANVLESAHRHGVRRVVHFASSLEYGVHMGPISETASPAPSTLRGAAKAAASLWCSQFARALGLDVIQLRVFSAYGYWEAPSRFIPRVLRSALTGAPLALKPGPRHDFVFAGDLMVAAERAATAKLDPGEILNLGSGVQWSNEEVVEIAERVTGRAIPIAATPYAGHPCDSSCWVAATEKARERLGWTPALSLEDGLAVTFAWMKAHPDRYA